MPITQIFLTSNAGGGPPPPSPQGTHYNNSLMVNWGSVGIDPDFPTYTASYTLPDTVNTAQIWEFNGSSQWMTTQNNTGFTQFYMNLWFYPTSSGRILMTIQDTQTGEGVAYHHSALEINSNLTVSGKFWANTYLTTGNTVTLNAWNHVYFRHNGTQTLLQLNGGTAVTANNSWSYPASLVLGFGTTSITNNGNSARYQGQISTFEMSSSSMSSNFDSTRTRFESPPIFLYDDLTIEWWQKAESTGGNVSPFTIGILPDTLELSLRYWGPTSGFSGKDMIGIGNGFSLTAQPVKNHYGVGWEHMALVRKDGGIKVYSNGVWYLDLGSSTNANSALDSLTAELAIGTGGEAPPGSFSHYQGYIKDFHIIKGYAKYTSNFTPSVFPTQPQTGSVFLLPVVSSGTAFDETVGLKTGTLVNTPSWAEDTPYPASTSTNVGPPAGFGYEIVVWTGADRTAINNAGVGPGWIITGDQGEGTITVTGIDYQHIYHAGQAWIFSSSTVFTFTSPDPGGSLYFNSGDYINFGSSVDFAFDVDGISTGSITLNIDANNPVSYSGNTSTWTDLSGTGNITLVGSPYYTAGSQSYLDFNGTSQYGTGAATNVIPSSAYTKMIWFKIDTFTADNNLVSSDGGGHFMYFNNTSTLYAGHSNVMPYNGFGSTVSFNSNTWYCVTVTYSETNGISMYINGVLDNNTAMIAHTGNGSTNIACFGAGGNLLNGKIGSVLCYGRELTAGEVLNNFNATRNRYGI